MKLIIPNEVQIGGNKIRIRISEKALDVANLSAQYSAYENIIRLSLIYEGKPRSIPRILESLIHEINHAIDGLYIRELEERQVGALASGLAQALLSIGIEPDFSQIPEETL
ncbi:hypothetical protein ES704_01968 [subsurface metagenome]|jgi:hypothetical protein